MAECNQCISLLSRPSAPPTIGQLYYNVAYDVDSMPAVHSSIAKWKIAQTQKNLSVTMFNSLMHFASQLAISFR